MEMPLKYSTLHLDERGDIYQIGDNPGYRPKKKTAKDFKRREKNKVARKTRKNKKR